MKLRTPMHTTAASRGVLALLMALSQAAQASNGSPQLIVNDAAPVVDSAGNQTMRFHLDAVIDRTPTTCPQNQPNCNARNFRICVDYTTLAGTANPGQDFLARSGRIDTQVHTEGVGLEVVPLGFVDITVLGDQLAEGKETLKLELRQPATGDCPVQYGINRPIGLGEIGDGVFGTPDLVVQSAGIDPQCRVQFMVKNQGTGTIPESAYTSATQASEVRVNVNGGSQSARLIDIDPQRMLMTPGATVGVFNWFQLINAFPKLEGSLQMQVTVDANGMITETLETNNMRRGGGTC